MGCGATLRVRGQNSLLALFPSKTPISGCRLLLSSVKVSQFWTVHVPPPSGSHNSDIQIQKCETLTNT
eukprot:3363474-Lingulodinium_polyedra.AAC.1